MSCCAYIGQVTLQETLFCYVDGLGPNNFSFPEAVPVFNSEINLTGIASEALITACGGNAECLFDGVVTGNIEVARESLATEETNEAEVAVLGINHSLPLSSCFSFGVQ